MIDPKSESTDPVQEVRKKEVKKEQELLGTITLHKGHTLFEVNLKERTILPAEYEEEIAEFPKLLDSNGNPINKKKSSGIAVIEYQDGRKKLTLGEVESKPKKLIRKENCTYIPALNKMNCLKKLEKKGLIKIIKNGK